MSKNVGSFLVKRESGSVDFAATTEKFASELKLYLASREMQDTAVSVAVHAVFDEHPGAVINMPALCSFALPKLGATSETWKELDARVKNYVRSSSDFEIRKGKGGGCSRKATATAAE